MINNNDGLFILETKNTTYMFRVTDTGHLEHLYYGTKIRSADGDGLIESHIFAPGNTIYYNDDNKGLSLSDVKLEFSSHGKGDIREPFIDISFDDGSRSPDFLYEGFRTAKGKSKKIGKDGLPGSYGNRQQVDNLYITLREKCSNLKLVLRYSVFYDCNVITRSALLINKGDKAVTVNRLMSSMLDFDNCDMVLHTFNGSWTREMKRSTIEVGAGTHVNESVTGNSSSKTNPFKQLGGLIF